MSYFYPVLTHPRSSGIEFWYYNSYIKKWVWEFRFEQDKIYLRKLGSNPVTIRRADIQEVRWQDKEIVFFTIGNTFVLDRNILSGKQHIEFSSILPYWVPREALSGEALAAIEVVERQTAQHLSVLEVPAKFSASPRYVFTEAKNVITIVISVVVIVGCLLWLFLFGFNILALLIIFAVGLALLVFLWVITSRSIEINNAELRYQVAFMKKFFKWDEIESMLVRNKSMTIWVNGRYSRVHLIEVSPEEGELFEKGFWAQIHAHGIPYEIVIEMDKIPEVV